MRYLKGRARAVQWFRWKQSKATVVVGYSDSDWAGCKKTRKPTSGGCVMVNGHTVKTWSKHQNVIATSSGEAELYAAAKCSSEVLGVQSMAIDLGMDLCAELRVDANATIGILSRHGLGKLRHIEVSELWLQELVKDKRIKLNKVLGTNNPADMMTKFLSGEEIQCYMSKLGFDFCA